MNGAGLRKLFEYPAAYCYSLEFDTIHTWYSKMASLLFSIIAGIADTDLTVYHVNPLHEGVIPVNMDTADLRGDIFFDLSSKTIPIECASPIAKYSSACSNE